MTHARPLIAVFGSSRARDPDPTYRMSFELGGELARAGAAVMTGGYSGIMEACSRGAHEAGGHVVGVTVELFEQRAPVNRWVKERVHTQTLYERLEYLVHHANGFIAVPGSLGTLNEVFLTWTLLSVSARPRVPLVLLGDQWPDFLKSLEHPEAVPAELFDYVDVAATPADAARRVLSAGPVASA